MIVPPDGSVNPELTVGVGKALGSLAPDRLIWIAENEDHAIRSFPRGCQA